MGFSRQEYSSGLPFPPPGDLPNSGIKPVSLASSAVTGGFFTTEPAGKQPHHRFPLKLFVRSLPSPRDMEKLRMQRDTFVFILYALFPGQ